MGHRICGRKVLDYILIVLFAAAVSLFLNQLFVSTGLTGISSEYGRVEARLYSVSFAEGLILYGIVSPVIEELIFRALGYKCLSRIQALRGFRAVMLSALLFAVYHRNLVQGLYAFSMGVLLALVFERHGSMFAPILFHSAANVATYLVSVKIGFSTGMSGALSCLLTGMISLAIFIAGYNRQKKKQESQES